MSEGIIDLYALLMGGVTGEAPLVDPWEALTFPLEMPEVSGIKSISWIKDEVVNFTESPYSFHRYYYSASGARWRALVELPAMNRENAGKWTSLLLHLNSGLKTFWFGDVFFPLPIGLAFGSPVVSGGSQTGTILQTEGWSPNIAGILRAGDKIQLGNYLHVVTRDTNSNALGQSTLDIWPKLRSSPTDGAMIITRYAKGLFRLNAPSQSLYTSEISRSFPSISFEVVEAL